MTKIPNKNNFKGKGLFYFMISKRFQPAMAGKAWHWECVIEDSYHIMVDWESGAGL